MLGDKKERKEGPGPWNSAPGQQGMTCPEMYTLEFNVIFALRRANPGSLVLTGPVPLTFFFSCKLMSIVNEMFISFVWSAAS